MKTANDPEKQRRNTGDFTCPALVCSPEKCLAAAQGINGSALPVWPGWRGRHGDAKSAHTHNPPAICTNWGTGQQKDINFFDFFPIPVNNKFLPNPFLYTPANSLPDVLQRPETKLSVFCCSRTRGQMTEVPGNIVGKQQRCRVAALVSQPIRGR